MTKLTAGRRDLIFLALLILMIKVAFNHKQVPQEHTVIYAPANHIHSSENQEEISSMEESQEEQAEELADEQTSGDMSLALASELEELEKVVHEPDEHIMHHINALFEQLGNMLAIVDPTSLSVTQLKGMRQRLLYLKRKYQHTSPAIVLLGPIGTAGIVLNEQSLENELLETAHKIGAMLSKLTASEQEFDPAKTINLALNQNKMLLSELRSKKTSDQETEI